MHILIIPYYPNLKLFVPCLYISQLFKPYMLDDYCTIIVFVLLIYLLSVAVNSQVSRTFLIYLAHSWRNFFFPFDINKRNPKRSPSGVLNVKYLVFNTLNSKKLFSSSVLNAIIFIIDEQCNLQFETALLTNCKTYIIIFIQVGSTFFSAYFFLG